MDVLESNLKNPYKNLTTTTECPRRASVGIIIRPSLFRTNSNSVDLEQYEILYIRRNFHPKDRWSAHLAFPGGRREPGETEKETAEREVLEEVGLDLKSSNFKLLGRLDDREVRNKLTTSVVMILSPFVYVQTCKITPEIVLQESEVASCYWVPISHLISEIPWSPVEYSLSTIIFRWRITRLDKVLNYLLGSISFFGIPIPADYRHSASDTEMAKAAIKRSFPLWGLTLWMTSDLLKMSGYPTIAHKGSPVYTSLDMNLILRLLSIEKQNPYLGTVEYRWGISTESAVRVAMIITVGFRLAAVYNAFWLMKLVLV